MKLHERLRDGLTRLILAEPEGRAISYGHDAISIGEGGHGTHGERGAPPPRVSPLAIEWAEFFGRALDMVELDLAVVQGRARLQPGRVGSAGRIAKGVATDRKRRIARSTIYRGRPSAFVAYVEGCSEALVQKTRAERGLDAFGLRIEKARPLTSRDLPIADSYPTED